MLRSRVRAVLVPLFLVTFLPLAAPAQDAGTGDQLSLLGHWGHGTCWAAAHAGDQVLVGHGAELEVHQHGGDGELDLLGRVTLPSPVQAIAVAGDLAYAATRDAGLRIVDCADPRRPVEVGAAWIPGEASDVAVAGGYAYVAAQDAGLRVIDVSDPAAPVEVGFVDTDGYATKLAVATDHVVLADGYGGYWNLGLVHVIDVGDPTTPAIVGTYEFTESSYVYAWCVDVAGDLAYVGYEHGYITVLDFSDPTTPVAVGGFDQGLDSIYDLELVGGTLYVAYAWTGLGVFDLTDPHFPLPVTAVDTPRVARRVAVGGDRAYVADQEGGLQVFDLSSPQAPVWEQAYATAGNSHDVCVRNGWAYVADEMFGLRILDLRQRTYPHEEGALELPGTAVTVDVMDGHAYVAAASAGLRVIDVTDPAAPVEVAYWDAGDSFESVLAHGGYVYTTESSGPLRIFDVSDPTSPVPVGFYDGWLNVRHAAYKDGYLICAQRNSYNSLWVFDVSDPAVISSVRILDLDGFSWDVAVGGDTCYLSAGSYGVHIIDVTDPSLANLIGTYDPSDGANGLETWNEFLFVAGGGRVWMLDVTDPAAPVWGGSYDNGGTSWEIAMLDGDPVVADHDDGVLVLRNAHMQPSGVGDVPALAAPRCHPNPCNPTTTVTFDVPRAGPVRVDVLDARGRHVARLLDTPRPAGPGRVAWRGTDDAGRAVASGVYFARVATVAGAATAKIALVR